MLLISIGPPEIVLPQNEVFAKFGSLAVFAK